MLYLQFPHDSNDLTTSKWKVPVRNYEAVPRGLFFKSPRPHDTRIGEVVLPTNDNQLDAISPSYILCGYPDDEGIQINHGRPGAAAAPDAIRTALYRMTPGNKNFPALYDLGNLNLQGSLLERHQRAENGARKVFQNRHRLISLGGGHDYAYPDVAAFLAQKHKKRPLVINLDAHLDMRPDDTGANSGTAFYRLLEKHRNFDLAVIGIQPFTNSTYFLKYAEKMKARVIPFADSHQKLAKVFQSLRGLGRPVFLSIDIDAFSSAFAPGASACYPVGLDPMELLGLLPWMNKNWDIKGLGIYEVSPPLDQDNRTSKLAAIIIHSFLNSVKK